MTKNNDISMNLDAHYSTSGKVERRKHVAVSAPKSVPTTKVYDVRQADKRWQALNNDIYQGAKKEQEKSSNVFSYILGVGIVFLGIIGIKKLIKFFKKS